MPVGMQKIDYDWDPNLVDPNQEGSLGPIDVIGGNQSGGMGGYQPMPYLNGDIGGQFHTMDQLDSGLSGNFDNGSGDDPWGFFGEITGGGDDDPFGFLGEEDDGNFLGEITNDSSGFWDNVGQGGGGGGFDWLSALSNPLLLSYLGMATQQWNNAGEYEDIANNAANRADPFGQYREGYGAKLKSLYDDPSQIVNTPGYKFALDQGVGALDRSNAAKGYLGAGKSSKDVMDYASGLASQTWNTEADRLSRLAGSQFDPANAGNFLMQGGANKINAQNSALGAIGAALSSIFGAAGGGSGQGAININNNLQGGNNQASGGDSRSAGGNAQGGNGQGGGGGQTLPGSNFPNYLGPGGGQGYGAGGQYANPNAGWGGMPAGLGAQGRIGADSLLNPDTQAWLQANGIDPNILTQSDLNILSPTGTFDPQDLVSHDYNYGIDPSTQNILNDINYHNIDPGVFQDGYFPGGGDSFGIGFGADDLNLDSIDFSNFDDIFGF
jgi:hypothetical protein